MDLESVVMGIAIPLISALIGGGMTLVGVILTINKQSKADDINRLHEAKPYIYTYEFGYDDREAKQRNEFLMCVNAQDNPDYAICSGVLKNTDNALFTIDRIQTERFSYLPVSGDVVEKNYIVDIIVRMPEGENLKNWKLYVNDIYENEYCYALNVVGNTFSIGNLISGPICKRGSIKKRG